MKLKDFCDTCVHFEWKKANACQHDRDTACAHAQFAWQAPSLGQIVYKFAIASLQYSETSL